MDSRGRTNLILRVIGFGLLISVAILLPMYQMFGLAFQFWIALAVCVLLTYWTFVLYRKFLTIVTCPHCRYRMTYQTIRKTGKCPQCGAGIPAANDSSRKPY